MIEHLSYSSISSYLGCGQNWKFHYLDEIKTSTSPELVFGSAFHGTIEEYLRGGADHPALLWPGQWAKQLELQPDIAFDVLETPKQFEDEGIRILSHPDIIKGIRAITPGIDEQGPKIERKVELRVPGVPVPIIGYIDIITSSGTPGDFKTSARSWTADKAVNEMQPLFYLAALNQAGQTVPGWRFVHYVFVKTKTPQFQMIEHVHSPTQVVWLFKMIKSVWDGIDRGVFPLNPGSWKCAPAYCEYWSLCRGKYG